MRNSKARGNEADSERERVRKKASKRKTIGWILVLILVLVLVGLGFVVGKEVMRVIFDKEEVVSKVYEPTVEIVDENNGAVIPKNMKEYVAKSEEDFRDLGYTIVRAVLPVGMMKEIDFYVEGFSGYIKVNIDRDTAVSAEDADRMMRYLNERGIVVNYVDVRVAGKGYYK